MFVIEGFSTSFTQTINLCFNTNSLLTWNQRVQPDDSQPQFLFTFWNSKESCITLSDSMWSIHFLSRTSNNEWKLIQTRQENSLPLQPQTNKRRQTDRQHTQPLSDLPCIAFLSTMTHRGHHSLSECVCVCEWVCVCSSDQFNEGCINEWVSEMTD